MHKFQNGNDSVKEYDLITNVANYYYDLVELAKDDLSLAHIQQHTDSALLALKIAGIKNIKPSGYSSCKPRDTVIFDQGYLTGQKLWVSNIPAGSNFVLGVQEADSVVLVLVNIDNNARVDMVPTLGMENTRTGHITFDHCPAIKLFEYNTAKGFLVKHQTALGFLTNHLGLCLALFNDIDQYTKHAQIDCSFEKNKIKLSLSTLTILWQSCLAQTNSIESDQLWHQYNTAYAFAKQTLLAVLHLILETTGSQLFETESEQHQRFKDGLIYSSHMKNLYFATKENLYQ